MKQKIVWNILDLILGILEIILGILIMWLEIRLLPYTCYDTSTEHFKIIIAVSVLTIFRIWDLIANIIRSKNEKNKQTYKTGKK